MFSKILGIFMSVIIFFGNILGMDTTDMKYAIYEDYSYGTHERNTMDLYIPKNKSKVGLLLCIHGGAWISGSKEMYSGYLQSLADKYDVACASINYRYIDENTDINDIMDDIQLAVECIKKLGEENHVKITKLLATGYSAGGHLSLLYCYSRADSSSIKPVAVISDSGPTDLTDENFYYNEELNCNSAIGSKEYIAQILSFACGQNFTYETRDTAKDALKKVSPVYYVDSDTVPTVINHGVKDDIVPFSNAYVLFNTLSANNVTCKINIFPNSGHGLDRDWSQKNTQEDLFASFIKEYLK